MDRKEQKRKHLQLITDVINTDSDLTVFGP